MDAEATLVLDRLEELVAHLVDDVSALVRVPSVGGTDGENEAQAEMARRLGDGGLDVDHWPIDLDALRADPEFPGMEVERAEA